MYLYTERLKGLSQAAAEKGGYVGHGYGQVEPNHLSAQRNSKVYAQLPAAPAIEVLEQGQFVKYDYANGLVNFTGAGEWMLVYNETKLYRPEQRDCEFAMHKDDYVARVYSPLDGVNGMEKLLEIDGQPFQSRFWGGVNPGLEAKAQMALDALLASGKIDADQAAAYMNIEKVTKNWRGEMENFYTDYQEDPFKNVYGPYKEALMPTGTTMVPRVFKTDIGDHYTTNMIMEAQGSLKLGDQLSPNANGILAKNGDGSMIWQVVKIYTCPDGQPGVKVLRIK